MPNAAQGSFANKGRRFLAPWIWWALVVCLSLAAYFRTLCPTIFVGDSGELVTAAHCLGIAHPPGYPLYCLVGRLMTLLPMGNAAQRVNFLSALCAALSAGFIFLLAARLGRKAVLVEKREIHLVTLRIWVPAVVAGLLCAFSLTLWSQAVVAEVYALHLFLLLLCLVFLSRWEERGENRYLFAFAFVLGLSLAHHPTTALAVPAFLLFLLWHRRKLFENWRNLLILLCLLILGLSVYFYLPLRSLAHPPLDWGHPTTLRGTIAHITRASYGSLSKNPRSWELLGEQIQAFLRLLGEQFGPVMLVLGLVGMVVLFGEVKDWLGVTFFLFLMSSLGIILLLNFLITPRDLYLVQVFFIPSFAIAALWVGIGIGWLTDKILTWAAPFGPRVRGLFSATLGVLFLFLAAMPLWKNFEASDRSQQYLAADVGKNILSTVQPGALLFTSRDTPTFSLAFARIVEGARLDVDLQHISRANIFRHLSPAPQSLDPQERPIYGTSCADLPQMPGWRPHQVGIVYQLRTAPMETDQRLRVWERYSLRGLEYGPRCEDFFLRELIRNYATARGNLAQDLAAEGRFQLALKEAERSLAMDTTFFGAHLSLGNVHFQMGSYAQAAAAYEKGLHWAPDHVEMMNNLALSHLKMGDAQKAIQIYHRSLALEPGLAKTHNDLGLAYKAAGLFGQAAEAYQRAIDLDLNYPDPLRNLGVIYAYYLPDYSRAITSWERYLDLRPQDEEREEIAAEIRRMRESENQ